MTLPETMRRMRRRKKSVPMPPEGAPSSESWVQGLRQHADVERGRAFAERNLRGARGAGVTRAAIAARRTTGE